jgi:DNA-binding transcriptional ArsR family regulator
VDEVFKALADPTRRSLLDELFREDGQTLGALEARFEISRFGVMKHLKLLDLSVAEARAGHPFT